MVRRLNPGGGEISHIRPDRLWCPTTLLNNGYRVSFPGVKRPERGVNHPSPSSAEVKERAELYLYSPSEPSQPVIINKRNWNFFWPAELLHVHKTRFHHVRVSLSTKTDNIIVRMLALCQIATHTYTLICPTGAYHVDPHPLKKKASVH
jgi:hypothetical protein